MIVNSACDLTAMTVLFIIGPNGRFEISSVPVTVVVIVTEGWLAVPAGIVIKKSMYPDPLIVFDADPFEKMPVALPNDNGAVTVSTLADAVGLSNETRAMNVVPAINVPLPEVHVKLVIDSIACALILMLNALLGPAFNERAVISSLPKVFAVIESD